MILQKPRRDKDGVAIVKTIGDIGALGIKLLNYSTSTEKAESVVEEIKERGGQAIAFRVDVLKRAADMVKILVETWGTLDVLVNNAGLVRPNMLMRMTLSQWQEVIDVNLNGVFCTKAALVQMLKKKESRIVSIASIAGLVGTDGQANYSAANSGVIGFTRTIAKEYGAKSGVIGFTRTIAEYDKRGISVNAIARGYISADLSTQLGEKEK